MKPTIKKVAGNGQISLPKRFRGMHVVLKESEESLLIQPLYWDEEKDQFKSPESSSALLKKLEFSQGEKNIPEKRKGFYMKKIKE